jgi:leucyl aminopeptidase
MHHNMLRPILVILLSSCTWQRVLSSALQGQIPLAPHHSQEVSGTSATGQHVVDGIIFATLETHANPVAALLSLHPELGTELAEERLLHIFGEEKPEWMTEGDKLHLDITDHQDFYASQQANVLSGHASELPQA